MLHSKVLPSLLCLLSPTLVTLLYKLFLISYEVVGMEILTHLRFTMNLKVRHEQAQQWIRNIRTHARGLQLVITTLLEIILVWNQAMASWRKTAFYVFSFLGQTSSAVHGFCLQAPAPTVSSPFDIWCVHSPWHVLILFKSEWKPSIWAYFKSPLRKGQESKNNDMFEVFSNISCRAFLSDWFCSSW